VAEINVSLVAVDRSIWSGPAQMVVARTVEGDIGVMAGHAPLLAQLREGFAARIIEPSGEVLGVAVHGGFLSVTKDGVTILAEDAQLSHEIDVSRARAAYERARAEGTDSAEAEAALRRAQAQLLAAGQDL
jgi:F-type H+-transporting ATPase subunit epsilon